MDGIRGPFVLTALTFSTGVSGRNAMAQVENVAGPGAGALSNSWTLMRQFVERRKQRHRIQIALDGRAVTDVRPRLVDVQCAIDTHHGRRRRRGSSLKNPEAPVPKWITGAPSGADALVRAREYGAGVTTLVVRAQRPYPAIRIPGSRAAPAATCRCREGRQHVDDLAHQPPPQRLVRLYISFLVRMRNCARRPPSII